MPFKAGYTTQIYSQKGTSLSDEAVVPSQYDLSCWWDVLTQTQGFLYIRLYLNIFDLLLFFIEIAFCFRFFC